MTSNPVAQSEAPVPRRHSGIALTPSQQKLLIEAATGCWCLPAFLELSAATGARRGELLALRWSDIQDGAVLIGEIPLADASRPRVQRHEKQEDEDHRPP